MTLFVGDACKLSTKMILTLVSIFLLMAPAEAFFRHLCFNPLGFGRIDPIMSPGNASQHVHHLHGSGNLGIDSITADQLLASNCTSCSITLDKSGYWAPAMYFQHENGTFELLTTASSITIYYKTEKRVNFEDKNYTAFPKGFRMIAGDSSKRVWEGPWPVPEQSLWGPNDTSQQALASKALGFNCLNYERGWDEATFAYPYLRSKQHIDTNCREGVRAEILFPSCWDGVNLDSPNHKSHVAYPTLLQDGACPSTHPVFLPVLFYETIWNTQQFKGVPGQFVMSNGDPTGYGYHGDFLAAWEDGILEQVMADPTCTDHNLGNRHSDGLQEHCPVFNGHLQSQDEAAKCKLDLPAKLAKEKVTGQVQGLPGGIQIKGVRHDPGSSPDDARPIQLSSSSTATVAQPVYSQSEQVTSAYTASSKSAPVNSLNTWPETTLPPATLTIPSDARPSSKTTTVSPKSSTLAGKNSLNTFPETTLPPATLIVPSVTSSGSKTVITSPSSSMLSSTYSTVTLFSNGIWYAVVQVIETVTVTTIMAPSTATAHVTAKVTPRNHGHGHLHHDAI